MDSKIFIAIARSNRQPKDPIHPPALRTWVPLESLRSAEAGSMIETMSGGPNMMKHP